MKVVAISDLHGYLPCDLPKGELLLIAGDILPLECQRNSEESEIWLKGEFTNWTKILPYKKIIFIAGNRDFFMERNPVVLQGMFPPYDRVAYIRDMEIKYTSEEDGKTYTIYGTPYCKQFGNWAFNRNGSELDKEYSKIPRHLDILLVHDAPYGVTDECLQWEYPEHLGNPNLYTAIVDKQPRYVIHGHLHSSSHQFNDLGLSKVVNVSLINEDYIPFYDPLQFDLD